MKTKVKIYNNCLDSDPCRHNVIIGKANSVIMTQTEIKKYLENKDLYDCIYICDTQIIMGLDKKLTVEKRQIPEEFTISDNDHLWQ